MEYIDVHVPSIRREILEHVHKIVLNPIKLV